MVTVLSTSSQQSAPKLEISQEIHRHADADSEIRIVIIVIIIITTIHSSSSALLPLTLPTAATAVCNYCTVVVLCSNIEKTKTVNRESVKSGALEQSQFSSGIHSPQSHNQQSTTKMNIQHAILYCIIIIIRNDCNEIYSTQRLAEMTTTEECSTRP
jgi:hypothetical protein